MTYSYSGDPSTSDLDEVRFWIQDTDEAGNGEWILTDEELKFLIATWFPISESLLLVSATAAEVIATKYTSQISISGDGVSVQLSELQNKYQTLATKLRDQAKALSASNTGPLLTGLLWDSGRDMTIQPLVFGIGFMDNFEAGRQNYGDRELRSTDYWDYYDPR